MKVMFGYPTTLYDCVEMLFLSTSEDISHVTFFAEKEGMVRISIDEFLMLTLDIKFPSDYFDDESKIPKLIEIFGDNFCFVFRNGSIHYIYSRDSMKGSGEYSMVSIDPGGYNSRWGTYDHEKKKSIIRGQLNLDSMLTTQP